MKQVPVPVFGLTVVFLIVPVFGLTVVFLIPLCELPQSLSQRNLGRKPEVTFKGCSISIGGGDISWLHGHKFFVRLEVEVCRENTSTNQFLLQDVHEVQQVFWLTTTDVIDGIRWDGQTIVTLLALWSTLHYTIYTLHDVIHIGKVSTTITVVENLDGLTLQQLVGESEVRHIGTTGRTIDRKEAQTC